MTDPVREALAELVACMDDFLDKGVDGARNAAWLAAWAAARAALAQEPAEPVAMLLFCPACNLQHIDAPQPDKDWTNPPHRSHECQGCGYVWRPSDHYTTGVESITTQGKVDRGAVPRFGVEPAPPADDLVRLQADSALAQCRVLLKPELEALQAEVAHHKNVLADYRGSYTLQKERAEAAEARAAAADAKLLRIITAYDEYRGRGVAPAPREYRDVVIAIDAARGAKP